MSFHKEIIISAISYLNTKPFIYGIEHAGLLTSYRMELDYPAECAQKLISGRADIGIVPVASLSLIPSAEIISDYCIGADGKAGSVLLLSEVPLRKIKKVYLDYQSRTSVILLKILLEKHWRHPVEFIHAKEGYEDRIQKDEAGLVIGDRTFTLRDKYIHVYDLAEEWKIFTGKPFVFAVWVSNRQIEKEFLYAFNKSLQFGIEHVTELIQVMEKENKLIAGAENYFRKNISYHFDGSKKEAMSLFLKYAGGFLPSLNSSIR